MLNEVKNNLQKVISKAGTIPTQVQSFLWKSQETIYRRRPQLKTIILKTKQNHSVVSATLSVRVAPFFYPRDNARSLPIIEKKQNCFYTSIGNALKKLKNILQRYFKESNFPLLFDQIYKIKFLSFLKMIVLTSELFNY